MIQLTNEEREQILSRLSLQSVEELFQDIPESIKNPTIEIPRAMSDLEIERELRSLSQHSAFDQVSFLGAGAYDHYVPSVVDHIASRSEFSTAYTSYQPEMSQGLLQVLFEYQTMMTHLIGLPVSNASLYEGATSFLEGILMALRLTRKTEVLLLEPLQPSYMSVLKTFLPHFVRVHTVPACDGRINKERLDEYKNNDNLACVGLQYPNYYGIVEDLDFIKPWTLERGCLSVVTGHPLAYSLYKTPGEWGIDIAAGEAQPLGIPLSFGGPFLGYFLCREDMIRQLPGRVCGKTQDSQGRDAYTYTLQTREQHIRRERASSNICSNQTLMAVRATAYMALLGTQGLQNVARMCYKKLARIKQEILENFPEIEIVGDHHFNEMLLKTPYTRKTMSSLAEKNGIQPGVIMEEEGGEKVNLLVATTEKTTDDMCLKLYDFFNDLRTM